MALYVNTNVSSLNAQRKLTNATNSLNVSYQRLASGLRINSAKDDAAGLQISDRLTSQINGLNQGNRNANDGIALAQTMEGALDETTNMLQRIRTLAIQAANGTNTTKDREAIQREVKQLSEEITRIACKSTYAGEQILAGAGKGLIGTSGDVIFQVGPNAYDTLSVTLSAGFTINGLMQLTGVDTNTAGEEPYDDGKCLITTDADPNNPIFSVSTTANAQTTLANIDKFIEAVDSCRADLGAVQNRMESTIRNQSNIAENQSDARSRIRDTDFAEETAALTQNTIIQQASQTILTQANQRPQIALSLLGG